MKIVEKRSAMEMFDDIVNRWKEQLIQGQTDTNELIFRLRDFVQTEFDINRIKSNRWIPCSERLPEPLQNVLVCTNINTVTVAWINGNDWTFADTGNGHVENWTFDDVKYWMSLPEPPANGAAE